MSPRIGCEAPSSVPCELQIKIVSWFLHQEGSVLPEIISRLTCVYGSENVDIVSATLYLQDLLQPSSALSDELEDVDDPDWENLGVPIKPESEEYTVLDDLLNQGENDDGFNLLKQEQKVEFRSRRKVMCSFCDKVHVNKYTLDIHITTHHPEAARDCQVCGKVYGLAELLNKHIRVKHNSSQKVVISHGADQDTLGWKCKHCDKIFKAKKSLENHSYVHLPTSDINCDICGKALRNPATLEKHKLNYHSRSGQFVCQVCQQDCESRVGLKQHLPLHGNLCKTCCAIFDTVEQLEEHAKTHVKNNFACDLCEKVLSTESSLKQHIKRLHTKDIESTKKSNVAMPELQSKITKRSCDQSLGKNTLVCETCGKPYGSATKLKNHVLYDHMQKEKPFQCTICQKRFAYKTEHDRHLERHSLEPNYPCKQCAKKFFTKSDMMRHIKVVHENYHAGSCDVCGRKFQSVGGKEWRQHMNTHAGIKNVCCPLCSKTFFTDETLKCHMISHYDTMYWSCGVCSKNFKRLKNVKYHIKAAHGLGNKEEIRQHCVKLRKAPTKAEIQELAEEKNAISGQSRPTAEEQEQKPTFIIQDFKEEIFGV